MFLVIVDSHTKLLEVFQMQNITSRKTIERLRSCFATHGLPDCIVSDNGQTFKSEEFREFTSANGIRHIFAAPYHPSSNVLAERAVQSSKEGTCTIAVARKLSANTALDHKSFACCNVASSTSKIETRLDSPEHEI